MTMVGSPISPTTQDLVDLSPKELEKKLTEIKWQRDFRDISTNELIRDLLSFSLSSDVLCELLDLLPGARELSLIAVHPSFNLHAAAHLGKAWASLGWHLLNYEGSPYPEVFSRHKSVFLAYAAASLGHFWYFYACMESTNLEGVGYLEREKLRVRDNEKAFMNLLQSLEEGGFPLLEVALTLLRDANCGFAAGQYSSSLGYNEETIFICELAKNIHSKPAN